MNMEMNIKVSLPTVLLLSEFTYSVANGLLDRTFLLLV